MLAIYNNLAFVSKTSHHIRTHVIEYLQRFNKQRALWRHRYSHFRIKMYLRFGMEYNNENKILCDPLIIGIEPFQWKSGEKR